MIFSLLKMNIASFFCYMRNWFAHTFLQRGDHWLLFFDLITSFAEEKPVVVPLVFFHFVSEGILEACGFEGCASYRTAMVFSPEV